MHGLVLHQLVAAGEENGVVERGAAAGTQAFDGLFQYWPVSPVRSATSSVEESKLTTMALSCSGRSATLDEFGGGFLLEVEALADAVAGIDEDGEAERQVGFGGELDDALRLLVLEDFEIVLREIGDEAALFVGDGEQQVDAVHFKNDAAAVVGRRRGGGPGIFLLGAERKHERNKGEHGENESLHGRTSYLIIAGWVRQVGVKSEAWLNPDPARPSGPHSRRQPVPPAGVRCACRVSRGPVSLPNGRSRRLSLPGRRPWPGFHLVPVSVFNSSCMPADSRAGSRSNPTKPLACDEVPTGPRPRPKK